MACLLLQPAAAAQAGDVAFLPAAEALLEGARYAPSEPQFRWTTWIGGGLTLARVGATSVSASARVETLVGSERRGFDANQVNYHLVAGLDHEFGSLEAGVFLGHVSRHLVDREKAPGVDWNVLGIRAARRFAGRWPTRLAIGLGYVTLASRAGYRFEATARLESDLPAGARRGPYGRAETRLVKADPSSELPRGSFADFSLEGGARFRSATRSLDLFVAYEHRNDVLLLEPSVRDRALVGFRFRAASQQP